MSIKVAAEKFKSWAHEKGILSYDPPEALEEPEPLDELTDTANPLAAERILKKKRINFVGVNEAANKIFVATHLKLTKTELAQLPEETDDGYVFEYFKSQSPLIKTPTAPSGNSISSYTDGILYSCGSSICVGNRVGAGTLGAIVRDAQGRLFGLTNNHVTGTMGYTDPSMPILAPGPLDVRAGGHDPFTIGHHLKAHPLQSGSPDNYDVTGNLDAALFSLADPMRLSTMQGSFYDTPILVGVPEGEMEVEKVGRTTGHTHGIIKAETVGYERVHVDIKSEAHLKADYYFKNVWAVVALPGEPFAEKGDSGALVVNRSQGQPPRAIGIVFAASPGMTYICPIKDILDYFQVTLVGGLTSSNSCPECRTWDPISIPTAR